jgi:hypothetical protein
MKTAETRDTNIWKIYTWHKNNFKIVEVKFDNEKQSIESLQVLRI